MDPKTDLSLSLAKEKERTGDKRAFGIFGVKRPFYFIGSNI